MKRFFKIVLAIFSILYMFITIPFAVQLLMGMPVWQRVIREETGIRVTENFRGGRIALVKSHNGYTSRLHRPVFEGPFGERNSGFVQIDWVSDTGLPAMVSEEFDYDEDGKPDFQLTLRPAEERATLTAYNEQVLNLMDKETIGSFIMKGRPDNSNAIFTYNDHSEALFLGYRMDELETLDRVRRLISPGGSAIFEQYLAAARKELPLEPGKLLLVDHLAGTVVSGTIHYEEGNRVILKTEAQGGRQELKLQLTPESDNVTVLPKTQYKEVKSVRVMLKKRRR